MNIFLCTFVAEVCTCRPETWRTCCSILDRKPTIQALQYTFSIASKSLGGRKKPALRWSVEISHLAFSKVTTPRKPTDLPAMQSELTDNTQNFLQTLKTILTLLIQIERKKKIVIPFLRCKDLCKWQSGSRTSPTDSPWQWALNSVHFSKSNFSILNTEAFAMHQKYFRVYAPECTKVLSTEISRFSNRVKHGTNQFCKVTAALGHRHFKGTLHNLYPIFLSYLT